MKMRKGIVYFLVAALWLWTVGWGTAEAGAEGGTESARAQALSQFISGNLAYKEGDYGKAVEAYESILRQGLENGVLYYNLGNSYLKHGAIGKAVLNYERARALIPRDSDLDFNYQYALAQTGRETEEEGSNFFLRLVRRWRNLYTLSEMAALIIGVSFLLGIVHLWSLYGKWPRNQQTAVLGVLLMFLFMGVWGFAAKAQFVSDRAVILTPAQAKFEPREDATIHYALPEGAAIKVIKEEGGWAKVKRRDGKAGWISQKVFEYIQP